MKESEFIEQNKEKWLDFENNLIKKDVDPSKTAKLFVQITDDLSYARTFYQNRSVKLYLNSIAKLLFNDLNKSNKKGFAAFINFWKKDLPLTVYHSRRAMLISLLVFIGCFTLGVVTSMKDKDFARSILSNSYVSMTNENIAKGDPMAVYKSESELKTFLPILYNNLKVDFLTFFSGIFIAIGSLVIMVVNGIMVGVFQYFFIERGLFWPSFLTIWTHGALEISAIILSGGAGLTLGKGLLFPGTHSRFQAFKLSGLNGLKIIMGVAPVTLLAAFIEGFLTRHTDIPDLVRLVFILASFAFIIGYFFLYPRRVAKNTSVEPDETNDALIYKPEVTFDPSEVHSTVKIVTETFRTFFSNFIFFGRILFLISLLCAVMVAYNPLNLFHAYDNSKFTLSDFYNYYNYPFIGILSGISVLIILFSFLFFMKRKLLPKEITTPLPQSPFLLKISFTFLLTAIIFVVIIFTDIDYTLVFAQILLPFLIFVACVSHYQNLSLYESIGYASSLISQSWQKFVLISITFVVLSLLIYATTLSALKTLFVHDAVIWVLTSDETVAAQISLGLSVFQTCLSFFLYVTLLLIANSYLFFTLKESYTAEHLISRIQAITATK